MIRHADVGGTSVTLLVGLERAVALPQHAGVELVDEDVVVGVLGHRRRPRLPVEVAHPLHHQHLTSLRSRDT